MVEAQAAPCSTAPDSERAIKCLSLTQPYASLIAARAKKIETRSWATSYRGPVAIHAAKAFPPDCRSLCAEEPFRSALHAAGLGSWMRLPRGAVIATATLRDVVSTTSGGLSLGEPELSFGDYGPRRFAWVLDDVQPLERPIPARGALGLWTFTWPEDDEGGSDA